MTTVASRIARISIAVSAVALWAAPPAEAVSPPPIDDSRLPRPTSPAPPEPTEQEGPCMSGGAPTTDAGRQLADLGLTTVWPLTRGAGQTVAVIDTGVARHRLLPRLVPGGDYVSTGDGTDDCDGHGTVVAGIIGASRDPDDDAGFGGVAPDATLIAFRQSSNVFRATADRAGSGFGNVDTLAMAVRTAADMGTTVINVSTVACTAADESLDDRALGAALSYAVDVKNVVVVTAAGNVGGQCRQQNSTSTGRPDWTDLNVIVSPAWYDDYVLTVASVDVDGAPSRFTLAGPWVDVAAPGEGVVSLDSDGEGRTATLVSAEGEMPIVGTSYAAPVVTGLVALIRSRSPELTARQVMQRIEDTAHHPADGWNPVVGHGIVDPQAAVTGGPAPAPTPNPLPRRATPDTPHNDGHATEVAVRGAAICVGVSAAFIAMSASVSRRRRRSDAVSLD